MTPEHEDERESLATAFIVVVLMFVFMSLFMSTVGAAEYTVTVEQSAHSVRVESEQSEKPLLFMYTTANCQPCELAKRELKAAKDLPFKLVFDRKPNIEIEAYPTFHWTTQTGGWTLEGWYGVKHLENEWRATLQPRSTNTRTRSAASLSLPTRHVWTFPGEIKQHLMLTHRLTEAELKSLTTEQAIALHSALHEGYSLSQIRSYARSRGMIK